MSTYGEAKPAGEHYEYLRRKSSEGQPASYYCGTQNIPF